MKQFFGKKSRSTLALVIMVSLALHVLAVVIFGTIKFVSVLREKEQVFEAVTIEPPLQKEPESTVNIQQRNQSTPPPRPPVIVVNNPSELDIPALDININVDSSSVYGRGGGGFGGGLAGVREMAVDFKLTDFGYTGKTEGTLEATLFDMKRNRSGKAISVNRQGEIREFTDSNWALSNLTKKFYTAKNKLYSSFWMIPHGPADRAPAAFGVEGDIQPSGIGALYQGTYTPRKNMKMRFVGFADDVLVVRLNGKIVLNGSLNAGYADVPYNRDGPSIPGMGPTNTGEWLDLKAGETYDLEILIAEIPGGFFYVWLLYQIEGRDLPIIFTTKPFTSEEKRLIKDIHPDLKDYL